MSRHRLDPPARVVPRPGRIGAAGFSMVVTVVALLAGLGVIPHDASYSPTRLASAHTDISSGTAGDALGTTGTTGTSGAKSRTATTPAPTQGSGSEQAKPVATDLPDGSGTGKRIVFDMGDQRVWLVGPHDAVLRTYLVSGSLTDNLHPGTYAVYSKSRWAVGIDESGVMQYFVRFTHGDNAAIGFHSIPTHLGKALQTRAQLGSPQSHGCIRQWLPDAKRLWSFAPVGTTVVVTA